MADNQYVNKVKYGDETLIDLTGDTVQEPDVAEGVIFHSPDGQQRTGTLPVSTLQTKTGDTKDNIVTFSDASSRSNIASGEKLSVIFAKIKKYFSDLGTWAFKSSGTSSDVGLGNVTNNKQVKGLASGTTENHVVTFGSDGYTVKDSGYTIGKSVPSDAKFTDTTYSAVTQSTNGLMTASDKKRMDSEGIFVICSTARNETAKVANCTGFVLQTGSHIFVKFTDTGTSNPASGNLTLNINNTGAKNIFICQAGSNIWQATYSHANYFYNNQVYEFVYDGTQWITFIGRDSDTWSANSKDVAGYVSAPTSSNANKVWKTDGSGNPAWRDEAQGSSISITNNLLATTPGTALDAVQGKVLKDSQDDLVTSLGGFTPVINEETGQITGYTTTIGGADTVFPFSKGACLTFSLTSNEVDSNTGRNITLGFRPSVIAIFAKGDQYGIRLLYNSIDDVYFGAEGYSDYDIGAKVKNVIIPNDTGFTIKNIKSNFKTQPYAGWTKKTLYCVAY